MRIGKAIERAYDQGFHDGIIVASMVWGVIIGIGILTVTVILAI